MENIKIRVKSPEHSKKIQEHLFSLGYRWNIGGDFRIMYRDFLFAYNDSLIGFSDDELFFNNNSFPEFELVETVSYEFKEIPKREVVKIGKKSYFLDELEIALKNINPI